MRWLLRCLGITPYPPSLEAMAFDMRAAQLLQRIATDPDAQERMRRACSVGITCAEAAEALSLAYGSGATVQT